MRRRGGLGLWGISLEILPRLKRLRDTHFSSRPENCVELPRLMTRYMKALDNPSDPPELRAGKKLKCLLENKRPVIEDGSLLARSGGRPLGNGEGERNGNMGFQRLALRPGRAEAGCYGMD